MICFFQIVFIVEQLRLARNNVVSQVGIAPQAFQICVVQLLRQSVGLHRCNVAGRCDAINQSKQNGKGEQVQRC